MDALFWDRDSHGLFDYESKYLIKNNCQITGCSLLARQGEDTLKPLLPSIDTAKEDSNFYPLISVVYKQNGYWIYNSKSLYKENGKEIDSDFDHSE